jgi:hypothetical protein
MVQRPRKRGCIHLIPHTFSWLTTTTTTTTTTTNISLAKHRGSWRICSMPNILCSLMAYCRVQKTFQLISILNQINSLHAISSEFFKLSFVLLLHSQKRFHLHSGLAAFPSKHVYTYTLSHECYIFCQSQPPWLGYFKYIRRRVKVMKFLIRQFNHTTYHFISLPSK